jgi:hypothetical protein
MKARAWPTRDVAWSRRGSALRALVGNERGACQGGDRNAASARRGGELRQGERGLRLGRACPRPGERKAGRSAPPVQRTRARGMMNRWGLRLWASPNKRMQRRPRSEFRIVPSMPLAAPVMRGVMPLRLPRFGCRHNCCNQIFRRVRYVKDHIYQRKPHIRQSYFGI